jgi:hypothetical protein
VNRVATTALLVALPAMLFAVRAVGLRRLVLPAGLGWVAGFLALGLLSGLLRGAPLPLMAAAALLGVKGWLLAGVVAQAGWSRPALRRLARIGAAAAVVTFAVSAVNLAVPAWFTSVAGGTATAVDYRWALPSLLGPFLFPLVYGNVTALAAVAFGAAALTTTGRARRTSAWFAAGCTVCALLSARRLVLVALVAAVLVYLVVRRSRRLWLWVGGAIAVAGAALSPLIVRVVRATVAEYFGAAEEPARTALTTGAFDVAGDYFPLGAGLGRYGSYLAGQQYSPEYRARGFDQIFGLRPEPPFNGYLTDTFWPAVLGEAGWLGVVAYVLAVAAVFRQVGRLAVRGSGPARTVGLMALLVWAAAVVLSLGNPLFVAAPLFLIPFVLSGIAAALDRAGPPPPDPKPAEGAR